MARLEARIARMTGLPEVWAAHWPNCRPISYELRSCASDRWVRFHSLPDSKRYPDDEREWAELLHRHHVVLQELIDETSTVDGLVVITAAWSETPDVVERHSDLVDALPDAEPWTSVLVERDDDGFEGEESWTHLFVTHVSNLDTLNPLLRLVAMDGTDGVIISNSGLDWLFCPYDGGVDVIAATTAHRDALRATHSDWLSAHPQGL